MGREVRRVPLDFDWPIGKIWEGFLMPEDVSPPVCSACEGEGISPRARFLKDQWYGWVPFRPEENGSTPHTYAHPAVMAFARRNVEHSPEYYGTGERWVELEARRLARLWDGSWSHHLNEADIAALVEGQRLRDLTHTYDRETRAYVERVNPDLSPAAVNAWSMQGFGHDSINCFIVVEDRCKREGSDFKCAECEGHGNIEAYPGQREAADNWERTDPPTGPGWQLWSTTTEGHPMTPVFEAPGDLASYCVGNVSVFGAEYGTIEQWMGIIVGGDLASIRIGNAIIF